MEQPLRLGDKLASTPDMPDVYSAAEIARAAGVRAEDIGFMERAGVLRSVDGRFFATAEAISAVRMLAGSAPGDRMLFRPTPPAEPPRGLPIVGSTSVHAVIIGVIALATTFGLSNA